MTTPKERFLTIDQLSPEMSFRLESTFQMGEDVWLWPSEDIHIEGHIQGVSFTDGHMVTYDVAVEVGNTGMYLVTYGIRGGITRPGGTYPGDDGGLDKATETPYTNPHRQHH